jgi:hypothetical protein
MNYGEDVAYWYLRLNGFFPLSNFVLHPMEADERQGDVDVLAVRPPFVFEQIGGQQDDFDPALFYGLPAPAWIGVVCEVKTSPRRQGDVFRRDHVAAAVRRLGLVPPDAVNVVLLKLDRTAVVREGAAAIVKLLIGDEVWDDPAYKRISLDEAEDFIDRRATRYADEKNRDRVYFPPGVFQYSIRKATRARRRR